MTELVHADALVVITVDRKTEQVLLSKAGGLAARAADTFVLVGGVWMIPIFRHIGINLVLADNDQVHAIGDHGVNNVRASSQHVSDDVPGALQRLVRDFGRSGNGHAFDIEAFFVELTGRVTVRLADELEERVWWGCHRRTLRVREQLAAD
jgi:hypothetical protein